MKKQKQVEAKTKEPKPCGDVWWCVNSMTETACIGARCRRAVGHAPPHADMRIGPPTFGKRCGVYIQWGIIQDDGSWQAHE